jgi:hypothetical protein
VTTNTVTLTFNTTVNYPDVRIVEYSGIGTPNDDIVEDKVVSATGCYSASSTQSVSNWWVMQLAAFRAVDCPERSERDRGLERADQ